MADEARAPSRQSASGRCVITAAGRPCFSLALCLAGVEVLYEALTGRDFPLHYRAPE
jgi:hypothetical protein